MNPQNRNKRLKKKKRQKLSDIKHVSKNKNLILHFENIGGNCPRNENKIKKIGNQKGKKRKNNRDCPGGPI